MFLFLFIYLCIYFFKEEVDRVWREHPEAKCSYMKSLGLHNLSSQEWHGGREGRGVVAGMKAGGVEGHPAPRPPGPCIPETGAVGESQEAFTSCFVFLSLTRTAALCSCQTRFLTGSWWLRTLEFLNIVMHSY